MSLSPHGIGREGGSGTSPTRLSWNSTAGISGTSPSPSPSADRSSWGASSGTFPAGRSSARDSGRTGHTSWTSLLKPRDEEEAFGENADIKASDSALAPSSREFGAPNPHRIDWDSPNVPEKPYDYSSRRKWKITGAALLASFLVPMHGTSIAVGAEAIANEFNVDDSHFPNSYWPIASWGLGCAVWIIVGLPLMEDLGIRKWFLINYLLFFIFIIPQAVAPNFTTLVVTRFFAGGFGELPTSAVASIIPDLWDDPKSRTLPVSLLNLGVMGGITIAPPIFAPVMQRIQNWRWIIYIQLILYGLLFPLFYFCIEETRGSVLLEQEAEKRRAENPNHPVYTDARNNAATLMEILRASMYRPFFLLATEPVLLSISLWSAFSFGNVFLFTQSTEQVYMDLYDWKFYETGYVLVALFIGEVIGWALNLLGLKFYMNSAKRNTEFPGKPIPESRLYVSIVGSFIGITGGMFVYGWTSYKYIHWLIPSIGLVMVGAGIQTVVCAACDYLEDAYASSDYGATAVSALAFLENIFGSFLPFAAHSMYKTLGFQWASSLVGILALIISFGPLLFLFKGRWFRDRSDFMSSNGSSAPGVALSGQGKHEQSDGNAEKPNA